MPITEIGNYVKKKIVKNVNNMETETLKTSCSHTHHEHNHCHTHQHDIHETKTKIVVFISALAMIAEILFGFITNSMALLSDGWHMASHVLAIGLTWFAYVYCRKNRTNAKFKNGTSKILSLSGYTSGLLLMVIALWMAFECVIRVFSTETILYNDAILVAIIGLGVNIICAMVLHSKHHNEDDNIKAAYLHVLSDALTSVLAIVALFLGKQFNLNWLDAVGGMIGSLVILKWSYSLIKQSGEKLLDYQHE